MNTKKIFGYGLFAVILVLAACSDPNDPNGGIPAPTCTTAGVETRTCSLDATHAETREIAIDPDKHNYATYKVLTPATCSAKGEEQADCSLNGSHAKDTREIPIAPKAHDYDWTQDQAPTVTEDGTETGICKHDSSHTAARTAYATGTPGLAFELIDDDTSYRVRKGTVTTGEVHIPAYYLNSTTKEYLPVTEIGDVSDGDVDGAFSEYNITVIHIPESVNSIGGYAFRNIYGITSITIPESVTTIGAGAFHQCINITSVTIPEGVTAINGQTFAECYNLTNITIPSGVTTIDDTAFWYCRNLTSIAVDNSNINYTSEGGMLYNKTKTVLIAFPSGTGNNITIPPSVTSIGNYAFLGCSITSITIPESVTSIGESAFSRCDNLTSIVLPSTLASISYGTFAYNTSLTEIIIPASVTAIGSYAFSGCTSLTEITIPASITAVSSRAFANWTESQTIYIQGHASQSEADTAWHYEHLPGLWHGGNAVIKYWNGTTWE